MQRVNESFFHKLTSSMKSGIVGTCALALREVARPDIRQTKSTLMGTVLRLGDIDTRSDEALEIVIKTSKCTALSRPKGWKKFAIRERLNDEDEEMADANSNDDDETKVTYAQLKLRTEYLVDRSGGNGEDEGGDVKMEDDDDDLLLDEGDAIEQEKREKEKAEQLEKVEKEQLVRGYKYGTTYAPCPDGQFARLHTKKGIDMCGFFPAKNVCAIGHTTRHFD
jgi:ATP-dependent DNA helicase 2 subunit 2